MTDQRLINTLKSKLRKELNEHRQELLLHDPQYVYDRSDKTAFFIEIYHYICHYDFLGIEEEQLFTKLLEEPNALEYLYSEYIKTDVADVYYEVERLFTYLGEKCTE